MGTAVEATLGPAQAPPEAPPRRAPGRRRIATRALAVAALAVAFLFDVAPLGALGPGDLFVAPVRVVLSGRTRSTEVKLLNQGSETATYRISFQNMRMTKEGRLETITEPGPGDLFADKLIRYSPRRIVLGPGETQTVRLLVRKPAGLAPGEYRSHLLFWGTPPKDIGTNIEARPSNDGEIRIRLIPVYGICIPIIVRHGKLSATVSISSLSLEPAQVAGEAPSLRFDLDRAGDRSVFGDLIVTYRASGADDIDVTTVYGIAVYTPNPSRAMRVPLHLPQGVALGNGRLRVVYRESSVDGGAVLAEAELALP